MTNAERILRQDVLDVLRDNGIVLRELEQLTLFGLVDWLRELPSLLVLVTNRLAGPRGPFAPPSPCRLGLG